MASRTKGSNEVFRDLWNRLPQDEHGNTILEDPMPGELGDGPIDEEIRAINERFKTANR